MIVHLQGTLEEKKPTRIVIDVSGVGYEIFIPLSTFDHLPTQGATVKLFTHHEVREDAQLLFGFATVAERDTFELMTSVSGVGPKLALTVLSGMSVGELQMAVSQGDAKRLATIKGIGKKTAERMVVELRDKVNPIEALANGKSAGDATKNSILRDAMLALTALGFSEEVARDKVEKVLAAEPQLDSTEVILRKALQG